MAVVITPAEFKEFFPEFELISDEIIQTRGLDLAQCFVECWCLLTGYDCERQVIMLIAAHFLTISLEQIGGDPLALKLTKSERIADLSVSFGLLVVDRSRLYSFLYLTSYGQIAYALLVNLVACKIGPFYQC